MQHRTGSALVLVLLLTLVLAAFGIVAMRDVAAGTRQSASFRARTQALLVSSSVSTAFTVRAGNKSTSYIGLLESPGIDPIGGGRVDRTHTDMGPTASGAGGLLPEQDATDSGLFKLKADSTSKTFESQQVTSWDVAIHSAMDGPPPIESSQGTCTKKVTISTRAQVGESDPTWSDTTRRIGRARHSQDATITGLCSTTGGSQ